MAEQGTIDSNTNMGKLDNLRSIIPCVSVMPLSGHFLIPFIADLGLIEHEGSSEMTRTEFEKLFSEYEIWSQ